jgi:polysaccharide export outer membrane protein
MDIINRAMSMVSILTPSARRFGLHGVVIVFCFGLFEVPALMAQSDSSTTQFTSPPTLQDLGPTEIQPGDVLDIQVFNTPELSGRARVDQSGSIRLPVGGSIYVKDLTPTLASEVIEKTLRDKQIMISPLVNIYISQYVGAGVEVIGDVRSPAIYPLRGTRSLSQVLTAAGGTVGPGSHVITIVSGVPGKADVVVDTDTPDYLQKLQSTTVSPGETVRVATAEKIFIVGDVKAPGPQIVPLGEHISVLEVLALCNGLNTTAKGDHASIIRGTPDGGAITIPVNLDKIYKNEAPNIRLMASDVVVVPRSGAKVFYQLALPTLTNAVVSAATSALVIR